MLRWIWMSDLDAVSILEGNDMMGGIMMNKFRKKSPEIAALVLMLLLLVLPVVGILNTGAAETSGADSVIRNGVSDGYYYEEYENHICNTSYRGSESESKDTSVSTFDGRGYRTPEAALTAFVEGMQEQDMEKMMSAFAVEEVVDRMQMDKMVEYWMGYMSQYGYVPDSKFAGQMNVMCRRNEIIDDLRTQYLYLIGSPLADDNISGSILSDYGGEVQELKEFCFPGNEVTFPEKIVLKGFFDIKKLAAASFEDEKIQGYIESGIQRSEKAYEGEIEPVSAWLVADGKDYLLCMDMIKYDDCWYGLRLGGTITYIIGITDAGGLISFEDVSEKGCELDYEGSVYMD